jgi:hypothetical protein
MRPDPFGPEPFIIRNYREESKDTVIIKSGKEKRRERRRKERKLK